MASQDHIRNPLEWGFDQVRFASLAVGSLVRSLRGSRDRDEALPKVNRIASADVWNALAKGFDDFGAFRTDVIFLGLIYPVAGLALMWWTFDFDMQPLLFPLASGFALIGPIAAVGLYEMSRQRERGAHIGWMDAFHVTKAPGFGAIFVLGLFLLTVFLLWLVTAIFIYGVTLGPEPPVSWLAFGRDVFTTEAGWTMIVAGVGAGFVFALFVLTISVVSFPMLVDRDAGLYPAILTSVRAVAVNPGPMALWGLIVACGLVIGSLPAFLGLIVAIPILGHATWHLYRKLVQ